MLPDPCVILSGAKDLARQRVSQETTNAGAFVEILRRDGSE
jgi:hypothetical protein